MKNSKQLYVIFIIILLSSFVITNISFAQTHIPYGDVSGIWTIDGSPYIIEGFVTVPIDSTLIIEPSVFVIFSTNNGLQIEGRLISEGTENDSIIFTVQDTSNNTGLAFYHTDITNQDSSKITYSIFEHVSVCFDKSSNILFRKSSVSKCVGWSGIFFDENSSPTLIDITISDNTTEYYGGGIYCTDSSNPSLVNVTISGNSATWGGGISCIYNSNPTLENVNIINNSGINAGGGIYCEESSPILNNVIILENEGSGICCTDESSPTLNNVTISNNNNGIACFNSSPILTDVIISGNSDYEGGGIYFEGTGTFLLQDVIITGNSALGMGGGVAVIGADMIMVNGIVADNYADDAGGIYCHDGVSLILTNVTVTGNSVDAGGIVGGIGCEFDCILNITNSIVWNNSPMDIYLYGYGCESYITYSDIGGEGWQGIGNINTDPLFADPENGDFHLSWDNFPIQDSTMSPCIDAGDPNLPLDPDSTRADMGAYYFDQTQNSVSNISIPKSEFMLYQNYPNPFITVTNISYNLPINIKNPTIEIFNIKGEKVKSLCAFPNGSLGTRSVVWDGRDQLKNQVSSGIYLYRIKTDDFVSKTKKMLLLR